MTSRLSEALRVVSCIDPDAYAAGTVFGDLVDMSDFHKALFVLQLGDAGSSATIDYAIVAGTGTDGTYVAIAAATATQLTEAGTDSNKQVVIEVDAQAVLIAGKRYIKDRLIVLVATSDVGALGLGAYARYAPESDLASVDEILPA